MECEFKGPINFIGEYNEKEIIVKGNVICIGNEMYNMPYQVHHIYTFSNHVIGYGKYFIGIINHNKKVKEYKCDSLVCRVWSYKNIFYAFTSNGIVYSLEEKLNKLCNLKYTMTCGNAFKRQLFCGNLFGYIYSYEINFKSFNTEMKENHTQINPLEKKIHDGTIYDINIFEKYVISCSNDRSICLMDFKLNLLFRVYNNKDRFFRCNLIIDSKFIEKLNNLKKNHDVKIGNFNFNEDIYYYGITDNGNLRIYQNNNLFYKYEPETAMIESIFVNNGILTCGYKSGIVQTKHIDKINKDEDFFANKKIKNEIDTILGFKPKILQKINNSVYATKKNKLYKVVNKTVEQIMQFDTPIINITHRNITLTDGIVFTSENYEKIEKKYELKNITATKDKFIGTRFGFLIYGLFSFKICDDALTGILILNNNVYISSRDGNIYFIFNFKAPFHKIEIPHSKIMREDLISIKLDCIGKKKISNDFLEGLLLINNKIYSFSFSHNSLNIYSFTDKSSFYIGCKPKTYYFIEKTFYFQKKLLLYNFELNIKEQNHEDQFLGSLYTNDNLYLFTENYLLNIIDGKITDNQYCPEISVVKFLYDKIFVGSQSGKIHILQEYENKTWEIFQTNIKTRIIDINTYSTNNKRYIIVLDGFGVITKILIESDYPLEEIGQFKILFVHSFYFIDNLYLISSDGNLFSYNENESLPITYIKQLHQCAFVQTRSFKIDECNYFLSFGDDHKINCYDQNLIKIHSVIYHCGKIVDLLIIEGGRIAISLSIDKTVVAFSIPNLNLIWRKKIKVNNPKRLMQKNGLYILGQGYEIIKIN